MAASNAIGEDELFAEFDRNRSAPDEILMRKYGATREISLTRGRHTFFSSDEDESLAEDTHVVAQDSRGDDESLNNGTKSKYAECIRLDFGRTDSDNEEVTVKSEENSKRINMLERELKEYKRQKILDSTPHEILRSQLRIIKPDRFHLKDDEGPVVQILFMNNKISQACKANVEKCVTDMIMCEVRRAFQGQTALPSRPNFLCLADAEDGLIKKRANLVSACTVIGSLQLHADFIVDVMGWPLDNYNPSLSVGWNIPIYEQHFKDPLPCEDVKEDENKFKPTPRPKLACFNCSGEHTLGACTAPRNLQRITAARRDYLNRSASSGGAETPPSRYHIERDPRFASLRAGVISDTLRQAMGVAADQLPPYIYQMRLLGYPPGHLEHALVQSSDSGLSLFDEHGRELLSSGEKLEEGEVKDRKQINTPVVYNSDLLIEYPGFNVRPPASIRDECDVFDMPAMKFSQSKEAMLKQYQFQSGGGGGSGVKRQLSADQGSRRTSSKFQKTEQDSGDMNVNDDSGSSRNSPAANVLSSTPTSHAPAHVRLVDLPLLPSTHAGARHAPGLSTPIIPQSNLPHSTSAVRNPLSGGDLDSSGGPSNYAAGKERSFSDVDPNSTTGGEEPPSSSSDPAVTPRGRLTHGASLGVQLGTPVSLDSLSGTPGSKGLPDSSRFAAGMSDHIAFENLPNSTGTYSRLRSVLALNRRTSS